MAGICTNSIRKSGGSCDHRVVSITLDGEALTWHGMEAELDAMAWDADAKQKLLTYLLKFCRVKGIALDNLINRVVLGEEATNVKIYQFFGPGAAITKTNIGTAYVNICTGLNGERIPVDFTSCTEYRIILHANLVGTGQFGARVINDANSDVLHDAPNLGAAGERELDTDWQPLPVAFQGLGLIRLRAQGKSQTGADDPVFRSMSLGLR